MQIKIKYEKSNISGSFVQFILTGMINWYELTVIKDIVIMLFYNTNIINVLSIDQK